MPLFSAVYFAASSTGISGPAAPARAVTDGLPPLPPAMSAWRQAQELTRKAEEEAMLAEKKSQEAYVWYVLSYAAMCLYTCCT